MSLGRTQKKYLEKTRTNLRTLLVEAECFGGKYVVGEAKLFVWSVCIADSCWSVECVPGLFGFL